MPNIKSAKKKVRQDRKKMVQNDKYRKSVSKAMKKPTESAFSIIDKALKKKVIHKNKAARLKSRISKSFAKKK